jgi:ubiquitin-protein ligase E3 A
VASQNLTNAFLYNKAGGVTREFFQLLSTQLFAIDTGMWTNKYQDGSITWFNAECSWQDQGYFLSGVLVGLAVYNSVVLDVHFPQAVYRKLLGLPLGLEDMIDEEVRAGLQALLDYDGPDVEEVFSISFDVPWMDLGVEKRRDLKPNGSNIPVTAENKEEYVLLYTKWLLQESIYPQYDAFEQGFMRVMENSSFELLRAEELELLVAGTPDLDFEALRKNTRRKTCKFSS